MVFVPYFCAELIFIRFFFRALPRVRLLRWFVPRQLWMCGSDFGFYGPVELAGRVGDGSPLFFLAQRDPCYKGFEDVLFHMGKVEGQVVGEPALFSRTAHVHIRMKTTPSSREALA